MSRLDGRLGEVDGFLYGWGRTKHIPLPEGDPNQSTYRQYAYCGTSGGHRPVEGRPVCKHCTKLSAADATRNGRSPK